ncbi:MAG: nucleotide exchange factor GrpE [Alphaproteobacteria bacterium]|nr:nucleotide exchange factor GrpE [Alphaproteobacteria bacterium]
MSEQENCEFQNDNSNKNGETKVDTNNTQQDDLEKQECDEDTLNLMEQIATLKDSLLRKTAEEENLRKRLEKEKLDAVKYANKNFAKDLLAVLDNFERINANIERLNVSIENDPNLKAYLDGISLCEKELITVFKKYGISKIEVTKGDSFNHEYHQAMCEVESNEHPAGSVMEVMQTGYSYNDRLLRPAMVSVSKK